MMIRVVSQGFLVLAIVCLFPLGLSAEHGLTKSAYSQPSLTQSTILEATAEISLAYSQKDFAKATKYFYTGSRFHLDLEPDDQRDGRDISYRDYLALMQNSLTLLEETQFESKIISIDIAADGQSAVVVREQEEVSTLYGQRWRDVSISETTFAYIDGQLKITRLDGKRLSYKPV